MIQRTINLPDLLSKKSFFLFGARGTGKTSLIARQLSGQAKIISLLNSDYYLRLAQRPAELGQLIENEKLVVIDEVQKLPLLLDEVHRLIQERDVTFLLTGSSARKLRRGGANLLAGRAWTARLFPLTSHEMGSFNLERWLTFGSLPAVHLSEYPREELHAYVQTYLTEEIAAEGIVRELPRFSRFLRAAAISSGELLNFQSLAGDLGVSPTTVREHYRILDDTLVGYFIEPLRSVKSRKEVSTAKFYLFDMGVRNALRGVTQIQRNTTDFGSAFEHMIALELIAALEYFRVLKPLHFWRTHTQQEVDFLVQDMIAVEVKATEKTQRRHAEHLLAYSALYPTKHLCVVSQDPVSRTEDGVQYLYYLEFLKRLWSGVLFTSGS